jgi:hypothetical protein
MKLISRNSLVFLIVIFTQLNCKTKVQVVKPEEVYIPKTSYDKQVSVINIPIEIPILELERQANKYLTGLLYEDKSFSDNGGDNLKCVVKKYAPIKINAYTNLIYIQLPLELLGSYTQLGAVVDFSGTLNVKYVTSITLEDNWKLKTLTKSNGYDWIKSPKIDLGLFNLPVTWIVDAVMSGQNDYIDKTIDETIQEYVDLKELTQPAFVALADPINVSETYKTWFKITPIEAMFTQLSTANKNIKISFGMKAHTETFIGPKPPTVDLTKGVPMKVVKSLEEGFNLGVVAVMPYTEISEILTKEFVASGYEYKEGKYHLTFTKMNIYGQNNKMIIEVGLLGSVKGTIYLVGTPYYDPTSRSIKMKDVDFEIDSKQKLLKAAGWLAHGKLCKTLQDNMTFDIGKELDLAKKDAQTYLTNYQPIQGVTINGKLDKLETSDVYLIQDAIVTMISVGGKFNVKIKDLE